MLKIKPKLVIALPLYVSLLAGCTQTIPESDETQAEIQKEEASIVFEVITEPEESSDTVVTEEVQADRELIHIEGRTIEDRFLLPDGFVRTEEDQGTFGRYLRELPLKAHGSKVIYYDGRTKNREGVYIGVVDMEISDRDLQQCADAIMRLRGEYLYGQNRTDEIHFNLTNGFRMDYSKWAEGYRVAVEGNETSWVKKKGASDTYEDFRAYMEFVFIYAGSLSLSQELVPVDFNTMAIGDILIQGGSPGHAVIVVDMAVNQETGEQAYILAQSYMPAQDIQILMNPVDETMSPWYTISAEREIRTPEWRFTREDLMRFAESTAN